MTFGMSVFSQVQCATDVTILEGGSFSLCENENVSINGSAGFDTYTWSGPVNTVAQSITPTTAGLYVLSAIDGIGCVSTDTIDVTVNPAPVPNIISSEGAIICPSTGTTLSTDVPFDAYNWGGGNVDPTFFVSTEGTYTVTVTDGKGCIGTGNFNITVPNFGITSSSTSACGGTATTLQATGGTSYIWSTGEFGSAIIVDPSESTNYSVAITAGACSEAVSIQVEPGTGLEFSLPDTIYLYENENVYLAGPTGFNSFNWYPSDQLDNENAQGVNFSGTESQNITMQATHISGCSITETVVIIVVGLTIPNGFSPNDDPYNQTFVIPEITSENYDTQLTVYNRWGEIVFDDPHYLNTWEGTCEAELCMGNSGLPEGTYFYNVDVQGVTFKGYLTLKR